MTLDTRAPPCPRCGYRMAGTGKVIRWAVNLPDQRVVELARRLFVLGAPATRASPAAIRDALIGFIQGDKA